MENQQLKTACNTVLCMIGDNAIACSHRYQFLDECELHALFDLVSFARNEIEKSEAVTGD